MFVNGIFHFFLVGVKPRTQSQTSKAVNRTTVHGPGNPAREERDFSPGRRSRTDSFSSHHSKQSLSSQHGALSLGDSQTAEDESDSFDSNSEYSSFSFSQDTFYESSQGSTAQFRSLAFPNEIQDVCSTGENFFLNNNKLLPEINTRGDEDDDNNSNDDHDKDDNNDNDAKDIDNIGGWKRVGRSMKFQTGSDGTDIEYYHAGCS